MLTRTKIGQAVALSKTRNQEQSVVGRIIKLHGTKLCEVSSIIEFSTPHGSIVKTGIAYCYDPNERELERLKEYEEDARNKNTFYRGLLCQKDLI